MKLRLFQTDDGDWSLTADGRQLGSWSSQVDALLKALEAFQEQAPPKEKRGPRFALDFVEGEQTVDKRLINVGAVELSREFPLPFMFVKERTFQHEGSTLVGVIESGGRVGESGFHFEGYFDSLSDNEDATEAHRLIKNKMMNSWSPDLAGGTGEMECVDEDENGDCVDFLVRITAATFVGGTMVPFQALDSAKITLLDEESEDDDEAVAAAAEPAAEAASPSSAQTALLPSFQLQANNALAAAGAWAPSRSYFEVEESEELHPLIIEGDRVYGYLAAWNVCHTGVRDRCVLAPRSQLDYGAFHVGSVVTAEGEMVRVGRLTIGTGHAPLRLREAEARNHYDHTGSAWALVRARDGERGIWVSGVVLPDVDEFTLHRARACALSGDWRQVVGSLELVAALSVPVPGFPLVASGTPAPSAVRVRAAFEDDVCVSLVAAGAIAIEQRRGDPRLLELQARVDELLAWREAVAPIVELLSPDAIAKLVPLVHGDNGHVTELAT